MNRKGQVLIIRHSNGHTFSVNYRISISATSTARVINKGRTSTFPYSFRAVKKGPINPTVGSINRVINVIEGHCVCVQGSKQTWIVMHAVWECSGAQCYPRCTHALSPLRGAARTCHLTLSPGVYCACVAQCVWLHGQVGLSATLSLSTNPPRAPWHPAAPTLPADAHRPTWYTWRSGIYVGGSPSVRSLRSRAMSR